MCTNVGGATGRAGSGVSATPANTVSQAASNAVNAVSEAAYNGRASQITRAVSTMFDELKPGNTKLSKAL